MSCSFGKKINPKNKMKKSGFETNFLEQKFSIKCYTKNLKGKLQIKMKWATIKWLQNADKFLASFHIK